MSTPTRQIPSRSNRTVIRNYSQLEQREVVIQNPPKTPKTPTPNTQPQGDRDIQMADGEEALNASEYLNSQTKSFNLQIHLRVEVFRLLVL